MSLSEEDKERRLAAKRNNERVKLVAVTLNASAIAIMGAAVILPAISELSLLTTAKPWLLMLVAFALHLSAQGVLGLLRSED